MQRLTNPTQAYAWGSATAIPDLRGQEPTGDPVAEWWMGAHASAPSCLVEEDGTPGPRLDEVIAADPARMLGEDVVARFGTGLPRGRIVQPAALDSLGQLVLVQDARRSAGRRRPDVEKQVEIGRAHV